MRYGAFAGRDGDDRKRERVMSVGSRATTPAQTLHRHFQHIIETLQPLLRSSERPMKRFGVKGSGKTNQLDQCNQTATVLSLHFANERPMNGPR